MGMRRKTCGKVSAAMAAAAMAMTGVVAPVVIPVETVFADSTAVNDTEVVQEIKVTGAETGATVKAYQLVAGEYRSSDKKLVKYSMTATGQLDTSVELSDLVQYDSKDEGNTTKLSAWVTSLANKIQTAGTTETYTLTEGDAGTYSVNAKPGLYLVLIEKAGTDKVYNPVLLSVSMTDVNTNVASGSAVALNTQFQNGSSTGYFKISSSDMDKTIVGVVDKDADGQETTAKDAKGDAVAIGDTVKFRIDNMTIPSFSSDYTAPVYELTDTLENTGFDAIKNMVIKVGGQVVDAANYTITEADGTTAFGDTSKSFKLSFTETYLRSLENASADNRAVEVTYESTLATTAGLNYAENYNHAELKYSNNASDESSYKTIKKNTYHYTFGIDANIDAEGTSASGDHDQWETHELNKVTTSGGETSFIDANTTYSKTSAKKTVKPAAALAGAVFGLYTDADCAKSAKALIDGNMADATATSDENGHITFLGLDEGVYYLKETTAPSGYTLSDTVYKIVINGEFDDNGYMTSYSITTTNTSSGEQIGSATYTNTYTLDDATGELTSNITEKVKGSITPVEITNTKTQALPFTGGEGRYVIYGGAVILAGLAVTLGIVKKKEENH